MDLIQELKDRGLPIPRAVREAEFELEKQLVFYYTSDISPDKYHNIQSAKSLDTDWHPFALSCKLGRFIRKYITDDLSYISHLVNDIVVKLTPQDESLFRFEIIPAKESYVTEKFSGRVSENSTISKSCMNNDFNYLKYYSKLKTTSLVLLDDMGIVARAVIWPTVYFKINGGLQVRTLLDRVYSSTPQTGLMLKRYARERGWVNKAKDNYMDCTLFELDGQVQNLDAYIEVIPPKWGEIPYFDTFKYPNEDENQLHNVPTGYYKVFTRSKGGFYWFCPVCNHQAKPEEVMPLIRQNGVIIGCNNCCLMSAITGEYASRHEDKISVLSKFNPKLSFIKRTDDASQYLVITVNGGHVYSPHYNKSLKRLVDSNGH